VIIFSPYPGRDRVWKKFDGVTLIPWSGIARYNKSNKYPPPSPIFVMSTALPKRITSYNLFVKELSAKLGKEKFQSLGGLPYAAKEWKKFTDAQKAEYAVRAKVMRTPSAPVAGVAGAVSKTRWNEFRTAWYAHRKMAAGNAKLPLDQKACSAYYKVFKTLSLAQQDAYLAINNMPKTPETPGAAPTTATTATSASDEEMMSEDEPMSDAEPVDEVMTPVGATVEVGA
jgi:hypothetical protein